MARGGSVTAFSKAGQFAQEFLSMIGHFVAGDDDNEAFRIDFCRDVFIQTLVVRLYQPAV